MMKTPPVTITFTALMLAAFLLAGQVVAATPVPATIVVKPGPFDSIQQAAAGEQHVNWWDDDPVDDAACTESFAALELRRFLAACTGVEADDIQLRTPEQTPAAGDVILVGTRQSNARMSSLTRAAAGNAVLDEPESFHIRTQSENDRLVTLIEGSDRVGALYGVYAYLEQLGMRFYGLGETGTVYPPAEVQPPRQLDLAESPHYLTRGFWVFENRGEREFFTWMARNRFNYWSIESVQDVHFLKKLSMKLTGGWHDVQHRCLDPESEYPYNHPTFEADENKPADPYPLSSGYLGDKNGDGRLTYVEAHPEWYALRGGKRSDRLDHSPTSGNYCTSNKHATRELAKNLVQLCIDGHWRYADVVDFWMLDMGKWCECQACKDQGPNTDRMMDTVYACMTALREAREQGRLKRRVQIAPLAYLDTLCPPSRPLPADFDYDNCYVTYFPIRRCYTHALADPACTEINRDQRKHYEGWATASGRFYSGAICVGEYYNVSSLVSLPVLFTRIMAADIPWYYETGVRHFHYMHTPTRLWGTWTLNQYLLGRLLWNTQADVNAILDEYYTRFYPTTARRTRTFYQHLERALTNIKVLKHSVDYKGKSYLLRRQLTKESEAFFPLDHLHYETHHPVLNDGLDLVEIVEAMSRSRRAIDDALLACADDVERARLLEDERRFAYGEAMIRFYYHIVRTAIFHRRGHDALARLEFTALDRQAEILHNIVDLVTCSYKCSVKNGMEATQAVRAYEFFKQRYGQAKGLSQEGR